MLFNIINQSDPYTLRAPDLEIAAVAICLLGEGKYGLEEIGGDRSGRVPMFLIGGHEEWFAKQFGRDFATTVNHVVGKRPEELCKALASVFIGTPADMLAFEEAAKACVDVEEIAVLKLKTHDEKRTSLNDIGRRAWHLSLAVVQAEQLKDQAQASTIQ